ARDRRAVDASARRLPGLQMDGEIVDLGRVGEHQDGKILAVDRHARRLVGDAAPALERRHRAARQAQPTGTDEGAGAAALGEMRRNMASEKTAEGKAGKVEALARREDAIEPGSGDR